MAILSYAYSTASSFVFRPDASTSTATAATAATGPSSSSSSSSYSAASGVALSKSTSIRRHHHAHHHHPSRRQTSNALPAVGDSAVPVTATTTAAVTATSTAAAAVAATAASKSAATLEGELLCDAINSTADLYAILGVVRKAPSETIRRAFLTRSRLIHPDKLPLYAASTPAFQRLSFAYETLSKSTSRRMYDLGGGRNDLMGKARATSSAASMDSGDETLNGVLRSVFAEFLEGDFEMIRVFVNALNEGNPGLNLGDEAVDNLEGAFRRVRESLLAGQKYLRLVKFELIRLYELQHLLRSLSYFDLLGRMRLTLALTRVTLEIPMVLDKAMREEIVRMPRSSNASRNSSRNCRDRSSNDEDEPEVNEEGEEERENGTTDEKEDGAQSTTATATNGGASTARSKNRNNRSKSRRNGRHSSNSNASSPANSSGGGGELQRRGLLGPRVKGVLVLACKVLEKGERFGI